VFAGGGVEKELKQIKSSWSSIGLSTCGGMDALGDIRNVGAMVAEGAEGDVSSYSGPWLILRDIKSVW
jgi:hypothetical protein